MLSRSQKPIISKNALQKLRMMGTEIASSDADWDYPLTDEDLRAIDSAAASKCHALTRRDDDGASAGSPPRTRRRLPDSLFVFRHQQNYSTRANSSTSPCSRNRFSGGGNGNNSRLSTFQEIKFGGLIKYSRTVEEVERAAEELLDFVEAQKRTEGQCVLGLDIEWRPSFVKGVAPGRAAVLQICRDNSCCHVLHIIHSGIPKNLQSLLEGCSSLKVGVCIANDATKVLQDHNVSINTLGDLSDLANQKLGGAPKKWSLSSLAEMFICRKLAKPNRIRLGNWEVGVLSMDQRRYAATDAYTSWYLYQVLKNHPDPAGNTSVEMVVN